MVGSTDDLSLFDVTDGDWSLAKAMGDVTFILAAGFFQLFTPDATTRVGTLYFWASILGTLFVIVQYWGVGETKLPFWMLVAGIIGQLSFFANEIMLNRAEPALGKSLAGYIAWNWSKMYLIQNFAERGAAPFYQAVIAWSDRDTGVMVAMSIVPILWDLFVTFRLVPGLLGKNYGPVQGMIFNIMQTYRYINVYLGNDARPKFITDFYPAEFVSGMLIMYVLIGTLFFLNFLFFLYQGYTTGVWNQDDTYTGPYEGKETMTGGRAAVCVQGRIPRQCGQVAVCEMSRKV
jgi:hypothetical protein